MHESKFDPQELSILDELGTEVKLNKLNQAAIVLLGLGEDVAGEVIKDFSRVEFERIAHAMSKMTGIKSSQAKSTVEEFFNEFKRHSGIRGANKHFLDSMLNSALGGNIGKGLVADLYGDDIREKMQRLQWIPTDILYKNIQSEHPKMQCAFLAYLTPETASEILELFPEEERIELLHSISLVEGLEQNVADDLLKLIEQCALEYTTNKAASLKGPKQVADIINRYNGEKGSLIRSLRDRDEEAFSEIESNMYDFYLVATQTEQTLEIIHEYIELDRWATALKGTDPRLQEAVFGSLTKRQKDELIAIMEEQGSVPVSTVKRIQNEILERMRDLDREGKIDLLLYQESVVE